MNSHEYFDFEKSINIVGLIIEETRLNKLSFWFLNRPGQRSRSGVNFTKKYRDNGNSCTLYSY